MTERDDSVKGRLLCAGRKEFLAYGFKGASLRRICAEAGVTTGALYFFFENKEDLFCRIVEEPLKLFLHMVREGAETELENPEAYPDTEGQLTDLLLQYREEYILLMDKAAGTRYEGFREQYQQMLEDTFRIFFHRYIGEDTDPALIHLITSMRFHGYLEMLNGNYPPEESRRLVNDMGVYADAGFKALVRKMNRGM